jgi:hypothetical protein
MATTVAGQPKVDRLLARDLVLHNRAAFYYELDMFQHLNMLQRIIRDSDQIRVVSIAV